MEISTGLQLSYSKHHSWDRLKQIKEFLIKSNKLWSPITTTVVKNKKISQLLQKLELHATCLYHLMNGRGKHHKKHKSNYDKC